MFLSMRRYAGTSSSLSFAFLDPKHHLHFLFSQQKVPTNPFLPDPETFLYQCFKPPATKDAASVGTKALEAQPCHTSSEIACSSWGKKVSSRRLESKALPWRVYSPARSSYILKFVLVSKHGCPWLVNVAALCEQALGTLRRGWPLLTHILPPHLHAFSSLFFKPFKGFFL